MDGIRLISMRVESSLAWDDLRSSFTFLLVTAQLCWTTSKFLEQCDDFSQPGSRELVTVEVEPLSGSCACATADGGSHNVSGQYVENDTRIWHRPNHRSNGNRA